MKSERRSCLQTVPRLRVGAEKKKKKRKSEPDALTQLKSEGIVGDLKRSQDIDLIVRAVERGSTGTMAVTKKETKAKLKGIGKKNDRGKKKKGPEAVQQSC